MDFKVVIWGADDSNVLGVLRALKDYGNSVLPLFQGRKSYIASASRYCHKPFFVTSYEEGIELLLKVGKTNSIKPFLITSTDLVAEYVDKNKSRLEKYFYLSGTEESGKLSKILDKYQMGMLAERIGFTVPQSVTVTYEFKDNPVGYPCLVKPHKNVFDHSKEFKTKVCYDKEQLSELLKTVNRNSTFVLQKYIEKDYDLLIYGSRLYSGEVVLAGSFIKDRWYKKADGSHGFLSPNIPACIDINCIDDFLCSISYYGLFSFEFGVKNDEAFFYEVNLRNDGTSHYFLQAGANIPIIWLTQFLNVDRSIYLNLHESEFIDEIYDYLNIKDGYVDQATWDKQRLSSTVFKYYDKRDIKPYLIQIVEKKIKKLLLPIKPILLKILENR